MLDAGSRSRAIAMLDAVVTNSPGVVGLPQEKWDPFVKIFEMVEQVASDRLTSTPRVQPLEPRNIKEVYRTFAQLRTLLGSARQAALAAQDVGKLEREIRYVGINLTLSLIVNAAIAAKAEILELQRA